MELQLLGSIDNIWFGALTLVPPLVAILLAFKTKNVYLSLGSGVYFGLVILNIYNWLFLDMFLINMNKIILFIFSFIAPILQVPTYIATVIGTSMGNAGIIMQVLLIGGFIQLFSYTGGARLLATKIAQYAKTKKSSLFITWILGLLVFFDDYANALIIGPIMRPIMDKAKVSREKLAFIIDATAAPIAGIALISTWIGFELGLIQNGLESVGINESAFNVFFNSIPFRFYNILILAFIVISIKLSRDFGPMLKAEALALNGKESPGLIKSDDEDDDNEVKEGITVNMWDGILPLVTLVFGALTFFYISGFTSILKGDDQGLINGVLANPVSFTSIQQAFSNASSAVVLLQSATLTLTVMFIRAFIKKQFNFEEGSNVVIKGARKMLSIVFILVLAWCLGSVLKGLGAAQYLTNVVPSDFPYYLIPSLGFLLSSLIAFATGTSYGTMGILMPLLIPLAYVINPDISFVTIAISSVLTGATFGDHCSPISDTTILSAAGSGCVHIEHVRTQLPYALIVGGLATILYIPGSMLVTSNSMIFISAGIMLLIGIIAIILILMFVGKDPAKVKLADLK